MKPFDIDLSDDEEYCGSDDILLMETGVRPVPPAPALTPAPPTAAVSASLPKKIGRKKKIAVAPTPAKAPVGDDSDVEIVQPVAPSAIANNEAQATAYAF